MTIDGYRDRENGLIFGVTPAGVRTDLEAPNDAEGALNFAWNAFWDAEVSRTDTGWAAEIRIPFTTLPYQPDEAGQVTMVITVWRNIGRKSEIVSWPAIEPLWSNPVAKASQTGDVVLQGLSRRRRRGGPASCARRVIPRRRRRARGRRRESVRPADDPATTAAGARPPSPLTSLRGTGYAY